MTGPLELELMTVVSFQVPENPTRAGPSARAASALNLQAIPSPGFIFEAVSLCSPGWPGSHKATCLSLPHAGIKGILFHISFLFYFLLVFEAGSYHLALASLELTI